ncbi:MAG: sulfite exporter TauE/SafE family protein [Pseudomonadota bacterium]
MFSIITDPWFYVAAVPAVILMGLSKGGLGGAFVLMGVPILSLVVSPVQAAAILLPALLMMDAVALYAWRGYFDRQLLWHTLPGAAVGIGVGFATAAITPEGVIRLVVGIVAIVFTAQHFIRAGLKSTEAREPSAVRGSFWGALAGFTSFVSHAGAPPFQVYALPLKMDPKIFTGTATIFFAAVNVLKLPAYAALGQFNVENVATSLALFPIGALATYAGALIVKRMSVAVFYNFMYAMVALIGIKMVYDGIVSIL